MLFILVKASVRDHMKYLWSKKKKNEWWKSHANWLRKDISCIFHILKTFLQRIFFFNVHARIACNAKAFRNVVLNQSFKFFSLQPFKTVFQSSFLFLEQNIASFACTMEKCLSRLWIANLKEVFFYELITINNQIEFIRMGLKHVFYFYPLYHWAHKKIRVSVYFSSASVHAKCDRKLLPSILQTSSAVFLCGGK